MNSIYYTMFSRNFATRRLVVYLSISFTLEILGLVIHLFYVNSYIGLLVGESNTLLDWGNMVDVSSEAKSSATGVTHPYRRTEHCDKIHEYRCDKEVGVIGIDISKEHLITSRGRVRKYENNLKGYEEILKMKPCVIVLELW